MSTLRAGVQRGRHPAHSSPAEAFKATLDLFATGLDLMRQNLRRSHPEADDQEIERRLQEWLTQRPGAESGDCPGRSLDVNTRLR
jgi:Rv0078B-related antitoxin